MSNSSKEFRDALQAKLGEVKGKLSNPAPAQLHPLTEVQSRLSIGRTTLYGLISSGDIRSVKIGERRLVSEQALRDFIAALEEGDPS